MEGEVLDPYVYRGTSVLINKAGIRDKEALKTYEYERAGLRAKELATAPLPAKFDYAHLKKIHEHLFKDVYDWAGQQRTIDLSKGGTTFDRKSRLDLIGDAISDKIEVQNGLKGLDKPQFVEKIAVLYGELNAFHPFREGNGRATREFLGQLARSAGYELDQRKIDNDKGQWNEAARQAVSKVNKDLAPIKAIFTAAIRPSRAVAFETLPKEEALKRHPDLARHFAALDDLLKQLPSKHPGNLKAQDHFFSQAYKETIRKLDQGAPSTLKSAGNAGEAKSDSPAAARLLVMAAMRSDMESRLASVQAANAPKRDVQQPVALVAQWQPTLQRKGVSR